MNDISVFFELTNGKFKSLLNGNCPYKDTLSIVNAVNNKIIYKGVPEHEVTGLIEKIDFQSMGYFSQSDFKIITTEEQNNPNLVNISISPACFYTLQDNFFLIPAPNNKSNMFLSLFCDEYERIKKRALYFFSKNNDKELVQMYALRNIQYIKNCYNISKTNFG